MARTTSKSGSKLTSKTSNGSGNNLGFENRLWAAADLLRGRMDAAEYKHVVLGLLFLKYISDAFQERYEQLRLWSADAESDYYIREERERYRVTEDRDEYIVANSGATGRVAGSSVREKKWLAQRP